MTIGDRVVIAGTGAAPAPLSKGFSLLELVLVLAILAVLAAIAAPRYAGAASRYRADCAARRIAADLGMARGRARAASASRSVVFTLSPASYKMPGVRDPDRPGSDYTVNLSEEPYRVTLVSVNFGGDAQVVFSGYGLPDSGGTVRVRAGDCEKTVVLEPANGEVSVQ